MADPTTVVFSDFWHQETVERSLAIARDRQRLSRSYLLTGPEGIGKWAAAHWLARCLLCTSTELRDRPCNSCDACRRVTAGVHPDCHVLFPVPRATADEDIPAFLAAKAKDPFAVIRFEKRPNLAIDRVRDLIAELSKTAVEGGLKVAILASAEQMQGDAQTILLKSIEEPSPGTYFILTSSDPGRLLPTVVSRCQTVLFRPVDPAVIARRLLEENLAGEDDAALVAQLSGGGWGKAVFLTGEEPREWRQAMLEFWRSAFARSTGDMLAEIDKLFNKRGFDETAQAFDIWSHLLRNNCAHPTGPENTPALGGGPVTDTETGWTCWKILQNGRSTLRVNVLPRSAVKGTFLSLRRRLHCL